MGQIIRFSGCDRAGRNVSGACSGRRPDRLAEILYNRGWRQLAIVRDGEQVGGIGPHPDTGRRIWWGESW